MPVFPSDMPVRLSPTRFVMRHYSIRGWEQGRRKVFEERLGRYSEFDKALFKMKKYDNYRDDPSTFVIDPSLTESMRRRREMEQRTEVQMGGGLTRFRNSAAPMKLEK